MLLFFLMIMNSQINRLLSCGFCLSVNGRFVLCCSSQIWSHSYSYLALTAHIQLSHKMSSKRRYNTTPSCHLHYCLVQRHHLEFYTHHHQVRHTPTSAVLAPCFCSLCTESSSSFMLSLYIFRSWLGCHLIREVFHIHLYSYTLFPQNPLSALCAL